MRSNRSLRMQFVKLDFPAKRAFYNALTDDERDAFYTYLTDSLIGRVHLTEKNRVDGALDVKRNNARGYIVPDECHRAENDCMWRSAAWFILMGRDAEVYDSLSHMRGHFEALRHVKQI